MSFSLSVKNELSGLPLGTEDEIQAELYGLMNFHKKSTNKGCIFSTDNKNIAERVISLLPDNSDKRIKKTNASYQVFAYLPINFNINDKLYSDCTDERILSALLRGIFLSCGSVTDPQSDYRLEFSSQDTVRHSFIVNTIEKIKIVHISLCTTKRHSKYIVYIKDNQQIIDILTFIGATQASMQFIQIKMIKEVRNYINRTTNFETANITKTTQAATNQIKAIEHIMKKNKFELLPESLKEIARLRLENPYSSLDELSAMSSQHLTKSGINYRLRKLIEISNQI